MKELLHSITKVLRHQGASLFPALNRGAWGCSLLLFALLLLGACERYEVEKYYDGTSEVTTTFDWTSKFGSVPDGMTYMWAKDGDVISYYDPSYRVLNRMDKMKSGTYYVTTMNNTFGEFGTMKFYNRNSHNEITAVANTYTITAENQWDKNHVYMEEPEDIGVAVDTFTVTSAQDELTFYNWQDSYEADTMRLNRKQVIMPMTTVLNITVMIRGISYIREIDGYITGLANGFMLNQVWRRTEVGNIKLNHWQRDNTHVNNTGEENVGWITTSVKTFGLPHGRELLKQRTAASNFILLHFTLIDGRTKDFSYNVGKDIRYVGDDGTLDLFKPADITLELNLMIDAPIYDMDEVPIIPYSQPEGSGQFDAEVQPWGDDVDVEVPM